LIFTTKIVFVKLKKRSKFMNGHGGNLLEPCKQIAMVETCKQQEISRMRVGRFTPVMISSSLSTSEIESR